MKLGVIRSGCSEEDFQYVKGKGLVIGRDHNLICQTTFLNGLDRVGDNRCSFEIGYIFMGNSFTSASGRNDTKTFFHLIG